MKLLSFLALLLLLGAVAAFLAPGFLQSPSVQTVAAWWSASCAALFLAIACHRASVR